MCFPYSSSHSELYLRLHISSTCLAPSMVHCTLRSYMSNSFSSLLVVWPGLFLFNFAKNFHEYFKQVFLYWITEEKLDNIFLYDSWMRVTENSHKSKVVRWISRTIHIKVIFHRFLINVSYMIFFNDSWTTYAYSWWNQGTSWIHLVKLICLWIYLKIHKGTSQLKLFQFLSMKVMYDTHWQITFRWPIYDCHERILYE